MKEKKEKPILAKANECGFKSANSFSVDFKLEIRI